MVKDKRRLTRESSIASGWTVEGQPEGLTAAPSNPEPAASEAIDPQPLEESGESQRELSSAALVLLGLLGGLYLLYAYVWFSWANAAAQVAAESGSQDVWGVLQQVMYWIAPLAPILWCITAFVLGRGRKLTRTVIWLLLGLVVLVPLPMFGGLFS